MNGSAGRDYSLYLIDPANNSGPPYILIAPKNTHFQRASFREERRCRTLKEMTIPAVIRLALHENIPTQNGCS